AIVESGKEFEAGLLYGSGRHEALLDAAKKLPEMGAARILLNDPAAVLQPHRAGKLVAELRELTGLHVGLYAQGAGGNALAAALDVQLRAQAAGDRLDEAIDEVAKVREEVGSPPLAAPIGQIVASQALLNVLSANRYSTMVDELRDLVTGRFGRTPGPVDPALVRAVEAYGVEPEEPVDLDALRDQAGGLASSEEELLLLALFGEEAEPLLRAIRERSGGEES